jgi:hypothetical protein
MASVWCMQMEKCKADWDALSLLISKHIEKHKQQDHAAADKPIS